jgi:hypothetical protein
LRPVFHVPGFTANFALVPDLGEGAFHLRQELRKAGRQGRFLGVDYDVHRPVQHSQFLSHRFPHPPPETIPLDSTPQGSAYRESHADITRRLRCATVPEEHRQVTRENTPTFAIDSVKGSVFQEPHVPRKTVCALRHPLLPLSALHRRSMEWEGRVYSRNPGLTDTRLRPLARRRDNTARPLLVFMRVRNPCVFERLRRFGWNVRFGMEDS